MATSSTEHLAILHAHGLTPALLERFASFCAQKKKGQFIFHTGPGGRILAYEEHHVGQVERLDRLLNMEESQDRGRRDGHERRPYTEEPQ